MVLGSGVPMLSISVLALRYSLITCMSQYSFFYGKATFCESAMKE